MDLANEKLSELNIEGEDILEETLTEIVQQLRKALPLSGLAPGEVLRIPKMDHYEGYTETNTVHLDDFLYADEEVDDLVAAGLLQLRFCVECGSHNTKPLRTFIFSIQSKCHSLEVISM